ncbi:uncharacterized protein LOC126733562 isoform X2 [Anthonomus grandis grandis]|uniref:uncharacterized protein LOC126733562 isoform X2 n=1 Tax=Anthonomus grandis grandis TaxID=2921223 RepID=UPI0021657B4F|nr:uncharacterized protein LOC126733562 isoform X2 [Anthonomus grandis grandis]
MWVKAIWVITLLVSLCSPTNSISLDSVRQQNFTIDLPSPIYTNPQRIDLRKTDYETKTLAKQQLQTIREIIAADFEQLEKSRQKDKKPKKEKSIQVTVEDSGFPTLEELRAKCQFLAKLYENLGEPSEEKPAKDEALNITTPIKLPEINRTFIPRVQETTTKALSKPTGTQAYPRVAISAVQSSTHKIITSTTTPNTTELPTKKINIRYTKFEPVILQKTILTDGRVIYNWYRSLPTTAVDFAELPPISSPPQFEYNPMAEEISERTPSGVHTTTTTTKRSSWFDPFGLFGGGIPEKEETTTTESSTSQPSTTISTTFRPKVQTSTPITTTPEPLVKIIVPVRYGPIDASRAPQNAPDTSYRQQLPSRQEITPPKIEHIPRFSLGYTGAGYGLGPYASPYDPDYLNYMRNMQMNRDVDGRL